jgi:hypothetical protein
MENMLGQETEIDDEHNPTRAKRVLIKVNPI